MRRQFVQTSALSFLSVPFPVLVGKNRVYNRGGCWLVFTSQEIGHLLSPHSGGPGTPLIRLRWCHFLTPYGWSAGWGGAMHLQCAFTGKCTFPISKVFITDNDQHSSLQCFCLHLLLNVWLHDQWWFITLFPWFAGCAHLGQDKIDTPFTNRS